MNFTALSWSWRWAGVDDVPMSDHIGEVAHDRLRRRQFLAGEARAAGVDRRLLLRMLAAAGAAGAAGVGAAAPAAAR
ncbi:hypothetical protein DY218_11895, partial [Streptomyces triticagri]